jgi:hypothetical protein
MGSILTDIFKRGNKGFFETVHVPTQVRNLVILKLCLYCYNFVVTVDKCNAEYWRTRSFFHRKLL